MSIKRWSTAKIEQRVQELGGMPGISSNNQVNSQIGEVNTQPCSRPSTKNGEMRAQPSNNTNTKIGEKRTQPDNNHNLRIGEPPRVQPGGDGEELRSKLNNLQNQYDHHSR